MNIKIFLTFSLFCSVLQQRNFVFSVLVDCALANLLAIGQIGAAEIFVFSRAIEDAVDMILMRSRSEAELARVLTEIEKLTGLSNIWERSSSRNLLDCKLAEKELDGITLRHVYYTRGTAVVRAEHVQIDPGIYALTGANGSGKSTLFRVLMSCDTNLKSIDLPPSITFSTPSVALVEDDDLLRENSCEVGINDDEDTGEDNEDVSDLASCQATKNDEGESTTCVVEEEKETAIDGALSSDDQKGATTLHVPKLSITMPHAHVEEISQNFYWPLYTKPIDWIFQEHISEYLDDDQLEQRARTVATELQSSKFASLCNPVVELFLENQFSFYLHLFKKSVLL